MDDSLRRLTDEEFTRAELSAWHSFAYHFRAARLAVPLDIAAAFLHAQKFNDEFERRQAAKAD